MQGSSQYRSQGIGIQYQHPSQRVNPSDSKRRMPNEEILQKLIEKIGTKINAKVYKKYENIRNILMSQMSMEKQITHVANSQNLRPKGSLPTDIEPKPKQLNMVSTRSG